MTRRSPSALALLASLFFVVGAADDEEPTAISTAPIYLPYYNAESWSLVRGSPVASDALAQETTYTIFCPDETPPRCDISLEFPFELVEGPDVVRFHGTYTSTYIANLECTLNGTTAATCSGYSSYKSGYSNGLHTGPTEVSWTSTLTGSEVEWGMLTMAEKPTTTDDSLDITAVAWTTPATGSSGFVTVSAATGSQDEGASTCSRADLGADVLPLSSDLFFTCGADILNKPGQPLKPKAAMTRVITDRRIPVKAKRVHRQWFQRHGLAAAATFHGVSPHPPPSLSLAAVPVSVPEPDVVVQPCSSQDLLWRAL
ncbi:hypothetical protein G7046_g8892 [Stylonectria norvegica]|nr:hypothetical protein G7046_g8892 [Stylonectria norvegica]